MKRHLLVALILSFIAVSARGEMKATVAYSKTDGAYIFSCWDSANKGTPYYYLELSLYPDFTRGKFTTAELKKKTSTGTPIYELKVKPSVLEPGNYYWRIINVATNNWATATNGRERIEFGTKIPVPHDLSIKDETDLPVLTLDDGTEIGLESKWLRSYNKGNNMFASVDYPKFGIAAMSRTYNHGAVVRDGIVFVSRGSYRTSGWVADKSRVWLERYDLETGEEYEMLRVRAPGGADYPATEVMPWVREDADGTIYFTTAKVGNAREMTLYTVDLSDVGIYTEEIQAKAVKRFSLPDDYEEAAYFTVEGSIESGDYRVWGMPEYKYINNYGKDIPVYRWTIKGGAMTEERSNFASPVWLIDGNVANGEGRPKLYPVEDDYFYMHSSRADHTAITMSVMLCRFVKDGDTEICSSFKDCPGLVPKVNHGNSGVSMLEIGGQPMLAYGIGTGDHFTAIQMVTTPSFTDSFDNHQVAWKLCGGSTSSNGTGMGSHYYQGCDVKYLPNDEGTGGHLLMYAPNAAMGLYGVKVASTPSAIGDIEGDGHAGPFVMCGDGVLTIDREVPGITIHDMNGRRVADYSHRASSYDVSGLGQGVYVVILKGLASPVKVIIR